VLQPFIAFIQVLQQKAINHDRNVNSTQAF